MKKILFLYNYREREYGIIEMISQQIREYDRNVEIYAEQFYDGLTKAIEISPHVIVTIPPRDNYSANYLSGLKIITGALVISMMTEGYFSYNEYDVVLSIGDNYYSENLVDFNIMWGKKTRKIFGERLLRDGKISDSRRLKTAGYAFYETEKAQEYYKRFCLPESLSGFRKVYKKVVLVLSGFLSKDMTVEDAFQGGYFGSNKKRSEISEEDRKLVRSMNMLEKEFCEKYMNDIVKAARENPDIGFMIKLHPIETAHTPDLYKELNEYENILVVNEAIPLGRIIKLADVMVHYNSTSSFEAYIYGIPTIQRYDGREKDIDYLAWQEKGAANYYFDIDDSRGFIDFIGTDIDFTECPRTEIKLLDYFNWRRNQPYWPVEMIAKIILTKQKAQRLSWKDRRNRSAVRSREVDQLRRLLRKQLLEDMTVGNRRRFFRLLMSDMKLAMFRIYADRAADDGEEGRKQG